VFFSPASLLLVGVLFTNKLFNQSANDATLISNKNKKITPCWCSFQQQASESERQ
jgi:hypothetical protein